MVVLIYSGRHRYHGGAELSYVGFAIMMSLRSFGRKPCRILSSRRLSPVVHAEALAELCLGLYVSSGTLVGSLFASPKLRGSGGWTELLL